ncbi:MAG TPA: hypothetical protein VN915_05165 [Elusimicrobiota bacterium]|nr:hypothetical protein [Elusimicrobiota bacterium]
MENEEKKEEGKSCGGCPCGKQNCCCRKAIGALALLIVGGAIGFFAGRHCTMCALKAAPAVSAPAAPAAPAK